MYSIHRLIVSLVLIAGLGSLVQAQDDPIDSLGEVLTSRQQALIDSKIDDWRRKGKTLSRKPSILSQLDTLPNQQLRDWLPKLPFDSSTSELTGLKVTLSKGVSRRSGNYPGEEPGNFTRVTLQGKGSLLGIPLTSRGFVSNEQSPWRPPMNGVSMGLDVPGLRREVTQALDQEIHELEKMIDPTSLSKLAELDELIGAAHDWAQEEAMIGQLTDYILQPEAWEAELEREVELRQSEARAKMDSLVGEKGDWVNDSIAALRSKLQILQRRVPQMQDSLSMMKKEVLDRRRKWHHYLMREKSNRLEVLELVHYRDSLQQHDPEKWAAYQRTKTLEELKQMESSDQRRALRKNGLVRKGQALMQSITAFEVGMSHPTHTDLTLKGQAINGLHLEMEPQRAFFAATAGRGANLSLAGNSNRRRVFGVGAGWGNRRKSHIRLTGIQSSDLAKSFRSDTVFAGLNDTTVYDSPRTNGVWSLAGQWSLNKALQFTVEMAQSRTIAQAVDSTLSASNFHAGRVMLGRAWQAGFSYQNEKGLVYRGKWERIEKGFQSFGVPFLRNDLEGFELRAQQSLFDRRMMVAPWTSQYRDRLGGEGEESTTMLTYGVTTLWKSKQGPEAQLNFLQSHLSGRLEQTVTQVNGAISYPYHIGDLRMISRVTWGWTQQRQSSRENVEKNTSEQLLISQLLSFRNGWQWSTNFNRLVGSSLHPGSRRQHLLRPQFQALANEYVEEVWNIIDSRLQMRCWGIWTTTVGGTLGVGTNDGFQWGWQVDSKVPVWQHFQLGVQVRFRDVESLEHNYRLFDGVLSAQFQF